MTNFLLDKSIFLRLLNFNPQWGKGAVCPDLNVFGSLPCRYAYAHDKNLKIIRKDFVC